MTLLSRLGCLGLALLVGAATQACSGGSGGEASPTSPTVATPGGCSGTPVDQVQVSLGANTPNSVNLQVFGETFNQTIGPSNTVITRSVVPCNYEIVGVMQGGSLSITFGRTSPFTNREAGVELGSVSVEEGPTWAFAPNDNNCAVRFNASSPNGPPPSGPFNIRVRFRVSNSNAVQSSGCGTPPVAVAPPAPAPPSTLPASLNGTYSGDAVGTGQFRLSAVVSNLVVSGVLRTPADAIVQGTIPISGTVTAAGVAVFTAIDDCGAAQYRMRGQISAAGSGGAVMVGTWEEDGAAGCRGATSGTFSLTRQ